MEGNLTMDELCRQHELLVGNQGMVRVPFLIKGRLATPPVVARAQVEQAFGEADPGATYVKLDQAQVVREPVIDRASMQPTGESQYLVLPALDPRALVERDPTCLVHGPYALSVEDVLAYLAGIVDILRCNGATAQRVLELCRRTAPYPDLFLDGAFASLEMGLDPQSARGMIDNELAIWGRRGGQFLDGWVAVEGEVAPGIAPLAALGLPGSTGLPAAGIPTCIRAMPTRQLHITAGNAPGVPIISALRGLLTKSAVVVKSPGGAILPGALFALAAATAAPDHPLTQHLSIVYWQGGDESVEAWLFMPNAFDRILVWGAPEAVTSVQARALFTKVISFNPRYGVSMIGREAFEDGLAGVAFQGAVDTMIYNQHACTASLVHYVEGSEDQAEEYAGHLRLALAQWDELAPQFLAPSTVGQLERMRRGRYVRAGWHVNRREDRFASGVVVMPDEFDILDHPLSRLVVVRPVPMLDDALQYLHQGVSAVGVYPEAQRLRLRDAIAGRGVSSILPLGHCEQAFAGTPHDGMLVLSQLVDWKSG
jgi:hypothetical protein